MFAVKGWSVSADKLKAETATGAAPAPNAADSDPKAASKKRKRPQADVTSLNVADLWEKVIEGKPAAGDKRKAKTQQAGDAQKQGPRDNGKKGGKAAAAKNKKARSDNEPAAGGQDQQQPKKDKSSQQTNPQTTLAMATTAVPSPGPKMTPMMIKMQEKLVSSRFRHLNELLYTRPSAEAFQLLDKEPEMFSQYHEGFRRQVDVWPENPVDGYLEDIKKRAQIKAPHKGKPGGGNGRSSSSNNTSFAQEPLPRTSGTCTIADLGCGDAKLASELQSKKKALRLDILSYDLQSPSPHVTRADIANLPLADGSVNVAIFCLALMGTNWLDFVEEAYRVLHWKGELWVAEIKSRLGHVGAPGGKRAPGGGGGGNNVVTHSVGNRKKAAAAANNKKAMSKDAEAADKAREAALAVEVDGAEDRRNETDVRAFVEALRKRGFVLQGEADLRNKMFVKMHFVKAAPATVGKNAFPPAGGNPGGDNNASGPIRGRDSRMGRVSAKFVESADDESSKAAESGILKPCLYKIR
ncbi:methyltransferase-domain-containing protein [Microdochium trichocladiopsis]|uniref:Ribosomal RNA-processing protein 8 n=1 Tax=Microdochium trichocladiopsis TaxID=1682393 RepID=A0A9P9BQJ5_9PEZI|nr:methyltransferase-domain-containing protein [Microdochium trichocladiopsis]KAH7030935.1 methyltransferase-domain-containing protein [Microdochium trichocladiopsis]